MMFSSYAFWLVLGLILAISELFATSIIAIFFGIGALIVGLLTLLGVVETLPMQLLLFSLISLAALFALRRRFQRWFKGTVSDRASGDLAGGHAGARVRVLSDFVAGAGQVQLNGAKWDAESAEPLKAGQTAWVVGNRGILLRVSATQP